MPTAADFVASTAISRVNSLSPFALTVRRVQTTSPPTPTPAIVPNQSPVPTPTPTPTPEPETPEPINIPVPVTVEPQDPTTPPPLVVPSVGSVRVTPSSGSLTVGDTFQLEAVARDGIGNSLPTANIGWSTSDTSVATVSSDGIVTALAMGSVNINAASEGRTGSAAISVSKKSVASVNLSSGSRPIDWGEELNLVAVVEDAQGNELLGRTVTWSSDNPSVATVSDDGTVTAVSAGKAMITAESEGKTRKIVLTIPPLPPRTGFELVINDIAVPAGATSVRVPGGSVVLSEPPQADGTYPSGTIVTMTVVPKSSSATYKWRNTDSQSGARATVVMNRVPSIYADITTVVPPVPVATVSVTPSSGSLGIGDGFQLTATPLDSAGNALSGRTIEWDTSNSSVATVSASGTVTGVALGDATISATSEGKTGSAAITVSEVSVASVSLTPSATSLDEGDTLTLQAVAKDDQGNTLGDRVITWTSSNSSVATVSADGTVTAAGRGTVVITAESAGKSSQVTLSVSAVPVATVEVSPSSASLTVGDSQQLTATAKNAGGVVLTGRTITWSSSNLSVASVNSSGNVTAVATGSATITATSEGKSGTSSFTVDTPTGGKIVFAREPEGVSGWDIYVMDPDGMNITRLTNGPIHNYDPAWSNDGSKIAFESHRDGNAEIYVMNSDGSGQFRLTNQGANDLRADWSADGTKIAFSSERDGNREIYVMDSDGLNQTRVTNNAAFDDYPSWSPDGTRIAFASLRDGNLQIYIMDSDGSNQARITSNLFKDDWPSWSPDGNKIAFVSDRDGNLEIYTMNVDGSNIIRLTNESAADVIPAWSPDGQKIVFRSNRDVKSQIYVMDSDGANPTRLTNFLGNDTEPDWGP